MDLLKVIEKEQPHFAEEKLKMLSDKEFKRIERFSKSDYWCSQTSVNVHDVVGTMHPDYAGNSWLNLLRYGKRMNTNLRLLNENPNYYYEITDKPSMEFIKINDEIYIGHDGNHRTCIAKFFFFFQRATTIHGVTLKEYIIDEDFESSFYRLSSLIDTMNLPLKIEVKSDRTHRADSAGWKRDTIILETFVRNSKTGFETCMTTDDISNFIAESQNPFRQWIGKFKELWRR